MVEASGDQNHAMTASRPLIRAFSPEVVAVLESLYQKGMTGWGQKHSRDLESAVESTGLNLSQVKVSVL